MTPSHLLFNTPTSRHLAILTHNPLSHSSFVYCVLTTRIYCRPTCAARPARRANIVFHNTSADAEAAGFRPCKRCRPELGSYEPQKEIIRRVCERIESVVREEGGEDGECRRGGELGLEALAKEAGWTKAHFQRVFRRVVGVSPRDYAERMRVRGREGKEMELESEDVPSLEIWDGSSSTYGSDGPTTPLDISLEAFPKDVPADSSLGDSRGSCLLSNSAKSSSKHIEFTIQPWFSSFVLIATTADGICALDSDDSPQELSQALRDQFPSAKLTSSAWHPGLDGGQMNANDGIYSAIMEALVKPTGKILDVPWDIT